MVQHVNALRVHVFGHLENPIQLVLEGRLTRSRQRKVTRSQSNLVCIHNEYVYTSAAPAAKCANLTITPRQRGDRGSPSVHPYGYLQRPPSLPAHPSSAICNKTGGECTRAVHYQGGVPVESLGEPEFQPRPALHPGDCSAGGSAITAGSPPHFALRSGRRAGRGTGNTARIAGLVFLASLPHSVRMLFPRSI